MLRGGSRRIGLVQAGVTLSSAVEAGRKWCNGNTKPMVAPRSFVKSASPGDCVGCPTISSVPDMGE